MTEISFDKTFNELQKRFDFLFIEVCTLFPKNQRYDFLNNWDSNHEYITSIINDFFDNDNPLIKDCLRICTAHFMCAFLMKLDEEFPEEQDLGENL